MRLNGLDMSRPVGTMGHAPVDDVHARGVMKKASILAIAAVSVIMAVFTVEDATREVFAQGASVKGTGGESFTGCRQCHEPFYTEWSMSPHGTSMTPYTDEFAARALVPPTGEITMGGHAYRLETGTGQGFMLEKGSWAWPAKQYRITHVLGGRDVYYFFTTAEKGRLTALPLAYDIRRKSWIERAAGGISHAEREVRGGETALVFSTACYGCHRDPTSTNYDLKTDSYHTGQPEPGIRCEACHGPTAEHAGIMRAATGGSAPKDLGIIRTGGFTPVRLNEVCAPCHASMSPVTASYVPSEPFFDHFDLVTLEDEGFFPDGRDHGANHTYTSWLMSPCARSGRLDCLHCHTLGGGYRFKERAKANDACLPCHEKTVRAVASHSHHGSLSSGSLCVSCHMPTTSSGTMRRTDHSMLPPTPASSAIYTSPNACITCHGDRGNDWADAWVRTRYRPDYQDPYLRRAELLARARRKDWSRLEETLAYLRFPDRDEVFSASLVRLLGECADASKVKVLLTALHDGSPLVRSSAATALGAVVTPEVTGELVKAAADPVRIVRIRAASALLHHPRGELPGEKARIVDRATGEYLGSLMVQQDNWVSHVGMGSYFLDQGDARNALMAFETASRLNPGAAVPHVQASIAHARLGDLNKAEAELNAALQIDFEDAPALLTMGLLKNRQGNQREAVAYLKRATKSDPTMAAAAYNLAVITAADRLNEAIAWARKAYELQPDASYGYTLAQLLKQDGQWDESIEVLGRLIGAHPLHADAYLLMGELLEKKGRTADAQAAYRQGLSVKGMPEPDRDRIEKRLKRIR